MAYPEHLIHDGETVALDLNPHWWYFIQHIAVGTGILGLVAIYLSFSALDGLLKPIIAGLLIFWAIWLGIRFMAWRNTYFVVTDRRVIFRSGFVAKRGVEIPLDRITNIDFQQGPIERIIGAGDRHPHHVQHALPRPLQHVSRNVVVAQRPGAADEGGDQIDALEHGAFLT